MNFDKILSIAGRPGLWEIKAQTRNGVVAQSLVDGKKLPVNIQNNISILAEIAIYTYTEEVPLRKVFQAIGEKNNFKKTISHKSSKTELEDFFQEILPEYDEDRVYASDIKKIIQWYNLLVEKGITDFSKEEEEANQEEENKKEESKKEN
ncbi:MAG: DUF5606 domain-containing protein [Psychroflexus maritimus]